MIGLRTSSSCSLALAAIVAGCGGSGGADSNDSAGTDGGTDDTIGDPSGPTEPGTDDTVGDASDAGTETAEDTTDPDTTSGETVEPAEWEAVLELSSRVVLEADDQGALTASCTVLHEGLPYDGDIAPTITVSPLRGVTMGETITFSEFDVYEVACEVAVEGEMLTATAEISVLNEAIDPSLAQLGAGLGQAQRGLLAILDADGEEDAVLVAARETLLAASPALAAEPYVELDDVLRQVPGDWPTSTALEQAGIAATPDDAALPAALAAFDDALAQLETTLVGIDPAALQDADLATLTERTEALQSAYEQLEALEPSAHGMLATKAQATTILRDRVRTSGAAITGWADALLQAEADRLFYVPAPDDVTLEPDPQRFGFLGLAIGSFGQSNLQVQLINKWYGKYIAELDKSINNLILIGAIDYFLPVDPNGPVIEYLVASASIGYAQPGYPSWVDGYNFHEDPEMNLFIVIGEQWQGILEQIFSACGVEEADTVPEKIYTVLECIEDIEEAVDSLFLEPLDVGPGIYGSVQGVDLGEFPEACSGPIPIAIGLIPINLAVGRGPSYTINCLSGGG
jgi:hypothetical protein